VHERAGAGKVTTDIYSTEGVFTGGAGRLGNELVGLAVRVEARRGGLGETPMTLEGGHID